MGLPSFDDGPDSSRMVWSLYVTRALPPIGPEASIELYYIGFENDAGVFNQGKALEHRHTLGARFGGYHNTALLTEIIHERRANVGRLRTGNAVRASVLVQPRSVDQL